MTKALILWAATLLLGAQEPRFETASIRLNGDAPCDGSSIQSMPGGGIRIGCVPLKGILTWAYQVQTYQIAGAPGWVETDQWNILAKVDREEVAGPQLPYEQMTDSERARSSELVRRRLQNLLADRFHLTLRRETREQPVYALTVGKNGPKLKESENQASAGSLRRGRGLLISKGSLLATVAQFLAIDLQRPVMDRTGLGKHYDFEIHWTNDDSGPSLFTAIQELGLKLEPSKGPVEMLIIDRVEKPEQ